MITTKTVTVKKPAPGYPKITITVVVEINEKHFGDEAKNELKNLSDRMAGWANEYALIISGND
jgi:hypothetical protein